MPADRQDMDSPWKVLLQRFFPAFLEFFYPDIYADVDWSRPPEFLDKELQQIVRDAELGRRYADKLVKVWLKSGSEVWVLAHIEVQGQREAGFASRIYTYNYRIFDAYEREVISLVVLADRDPNWRPEEYRWERWGAGVTLRFRVAKLLEYRDGREELEQSANPFAVIVLAFLEMMDTEGDMGARLESKWGLIRRLYARGRPSGEVLELVRAVDWLMHLPSDLEEHLRTRVHQIEMENRMPYVSPLEELAIEEGLERGLERGQQGMRRQFMRMLRNRFAIVPEEVEARLHGLDVDQLEALVDEAFAVDSLEQFLERVPQATGPNEAGA